jgi:hypothetical protein
MKATILSLGLAGILGGCVVYPDRVVTEAVIFDSYGYGYSDDAALLTVDVVTDLDLCPLRHFEMGELTAEIDEGWNQPCDDLGRWLEGDEIVLGFDCYGPFDGEVELKLTNLTEHDWSPTVHFGGVGLGSRAVRVEPFSTSVLPIRWLD